MLDHLAELVHAALVRRDLGAQVGDVLRRVAGRVGVVGQRLHQRVLAEPSALDEAQVVDQHAFFFHGRRPRRHRARRRPADVGMMPARRDPEQDCLALEIEHRRAHGDVGQVRAAVVGRVQREHVARVNVAGVEANDRLDRAVHRAEMHRHMRRVGDQPPVAIEDRAGEVEPLLDVHRIGGVLQRHAHLLGDRHEEVVEDLQHHRVGLRAERGALRQRHRARQARRGRAP